MRVCVSDLTSSPDMRTTARVLSTLFYITPRRKLLYVTDVWQASSPTPLPTQIGRAHV